MNNLAALLSKSKDSSSVKPDSADVTTDPSADSATSDDISSAGDDEGFNEAAQEAMTALQGQDVQGFAEALKHCIEMV